MTATTLALGGREREPSTPSACGAAGRRVLRLGGEEPIEREFMLQERHAQHDETRELLDAQVGLEKRIHDALKVSDATGDDPQQEVVSAADVVAIHDLGEFLGRDFEAPEVLPPVIAERHFGEDDQEIAELRQGQMRAIALDDTDLLQAFDPGEARTGAQSDRIREFDVGAAPLLLEMRQDLEVKAIQFEPRAHAPQCPVQPVAPAGAASASASSMPWTTMATCSPVSTSGGRILSTL